MILRELTMGRPRKCVLKRTYSCSRRYSNSFIIREKHLFVSLDPEIHEEEAATFLYNLLTDDSCQPSEVHEGKNCAKASTRGLLKVNREKLIALNEIEGLALSTKVTNIEVQKDEKVAAFRVIPLTISKSQLEKARQLSTSEPLISVKPFKNTGRDCNYWQ